MTGELAADVASSQAIKQVLSLPPLSDLRKTVTRFEGVLYKKTRLLGFKSKYVVLDNGVLSVFSSRSVCLTVHTTDYSSSKTMPTILVLLYLPCRDDSWFKSV